MDDTKRLTLAEMAKRLNVTPKTLRKAIREKRIAFFRIGKSMRFDPIEVEAFFRVEQAAKKPMVRKGVVNSPGRFAERLGI